MRILSALILSLCVTSVLSAEEPARPNILLAIADDWGWPHAGAYRDPVVKTPTFDTLAKEGVLFRHAYVSSPSCTSSRAALLTGQWHWRLEESANLWSTLQKKFPVYPELLQEAGYFVGHSRKGWGPGRLPPGGRTVNPAGPRFKNFKEFLAKRPRDKPFCFWFGSSDPHRGYKPGSGKAAGIDPDNIELFPHFPDTPTIRSDVADYYFEVQRFDREVGERVEMIRALGELDNTIVVMTGDHGMPFPRCKSNLYDSGARVPLAIRWPAGIAKPRRIVTDFVSLTDLAPTFLEAANLLPPDQMTGRSLMPQLTADRGGRVDTGRNQVFTGKERHCPNQEGDLTGGYPMRAIRTDDFLLIHNPEPDRWPAGTPNDDKANFKGSWYGDIDGGPTKMEMIRLKDSHRELFELSFGKRPEYELFDLKTDPDQMKNVAANPAYADTLKQLSDQLAKALLATGDLRALGKAKMLEAYPYYGGAPKRPK